MVEMRRKLNLTSIRDLLSILALICLVIPAKADNGDGFPFPDGAAVAMVEQSNGITACQYYFGACDGFQVWRKDSSRVEEVWQRMDDAPVAIGSSPIVKFGTSWIILFASDATVWHFNTITNSWSIGGKVAKVPVSAKTVDGQILLEFQDGGEDIYDFGNNTKSLKSFCFWDYLALIGYLLLIVLLSVGFTRKTKTSKDFFLGGQKIPFWAAGLSLMAAQVSSIGFMSIPAKSFATNWSYFAGVLTWFVVVPIVIYVFVPFYRRLNVTSAYEYLEKRFNVFIRKFVASLYLLFQLFGRLGALIFLPAIALSAVTGIAPVWSILIIGGLATLYTILGGMKAVIWIDVIQAIVLFGAIFICIGFVIGGIDGGARTVFDVASQNSKFSLGRMDWDMTAAVFWVIVMGNIFNRLGSNATDQSVVQRYLTTKDEKETAKALWTDAFVSIPWALCVFGLGTALFVFYKMNPGMITPQVTNDEIVPFFIGQNLPAGLRGIVIAGIFAASMSSVDSSIHSTTTVIIKDFLEKKSARNDETGKVKMARTITSIIGALGTVIAIVMTWFDIASVWDVILEALGLFTGSMTGVFILGIFFEKANGKGAIVGTVASAFILLAVKTWTPLSFFLYSGIGIISCILIGAISSMFFHDDKSTDGLTIYSVGK